MSIKTELLELASTGSTVVFVRDHSNHVKADMVETDQIEVCRMGDAVLLLAAGHGSHMVGFAIPLSQLELLVAGESFDKSLDTPKVTE